MRHEAAIASTPRKPRRWISAAIHALDPAADCARIMSLIYDWRYSDPMTHHLMYTIGFARQVADPAIARVIDAGGRGPIVRSGPARANLTLRFFGEWFRHGPDSDYGRASLQRLNAIHARFQISNAQYLYTLATLAVFPQRLFKLIGRPGFDAHEQRAIAALWGRVGAAMNLDDIPSDFAAFERYFDDYEARNFRWSAEGQRCAEALVNDFATRWLGGRWPRLARAWVLAHFDRPLRRVFQFTYPGPLATAVLRLPSFARCLAIERVLPDPGEPRWLMESFSEA